MKKSIKGFVLGLIIATLLMSTALGSGVRQSIDVVINSINLTVNGQSVSADNFVYEGTTYVPLRAIGEMLGKDVGWDNTTKTASVNDKGIYIPIPEPTQKPQGETLSQKNAIKKAESYLQLTAFSRTGLIEQLEYSGFSNEDAVYAVNKINPSWKEQAVKKAESYLQLTAFSRTGLIEQLEYSGFSNEEAIYAVNQIGI
jgi:hypothetical protein